MAMLIHRAPIANYIRVAETLASNMRQCRHAGQSCATVERIAHDLADIYSSADSAFPRTRFLRVAGVGL